MRAAHAVAALYLGAGLFAAPAAYAHSLGLSQSETVVQADGRVTMELVFAATEALTNVTLDQDHDGVVTDAEVEAARPDLRRLVVDQIEVDADGRVCPGELEGAAIVAQDALDLQATYACPQGATEYGITFFFLSDLKGHQHSARITAGRATGEKLLGPMNRFLSLTLPEAGARKREITGWRRTALVVVSVVFAVFMLGLTAWRWKTAPRRRR